MIHGQKNFKLKPRRFVIVPAMVHDTVAIPLL